MRRCPRVISLVARLAVLLALGLPATFACAGDARAQPAGDAKARSPDGRWIVWVKPTPATTVETDSGKSPATELWLARADGSNARRLLRGRPDRDPKRQLANLSEPRFSPDGRTVYVLSEAWVTSGAVHAVDIASGREHFVCAGNSLDVVPRGRYAGDLLVSQHRYFLGGGSYDWVWLVTPAGKTVGPVGPDEEGSTAVADFLETSAGK